MAKFSRIIFISVIFIVSSIYSTAQVNAVVFGKNKIQHGNKKWNFYQSTHFSVFFYDDGEEIAKFVMQSAEKELTEIQAEAEYRIRKRTNIILYNSYKDYQQTNIGLETDIINNGGNTELVNNKMLIYFDGNHSNLRIHIREGIADVLIKNILFGDDLSETAGNQTLLDLPKWYVNGYKAYLAEHWNTSLDDELKGEILSGDYTKFTRFAFENPTLAGHAFWYFIEEKYKKENTTYFFYLSRTFKSMNKASVQITKKKFNDLAKEFMQYQEDKYTLDIYRRKNYPKGNLIDGFDITPRLNYYQFNVNPNKKNSSYTVTQFKKGKIRVILNDNDEKTTLLKYGILSLENERDPAYPLTAWDPKGTKLSMIFSMNGKLKLMLYDVNAKSEMFTIDLTHEFNQVLDVKYMLDSRTLLLSAVKNGHTDIFTYDLEKEKSTQITNDVYDNLDPAFVTFPNKTGIIFVSNRPSSDAVSSDNVLPSDNRFNVFMITNFGDKPELNQITQLTKLKYGNARYPAQYNVNHFTFVSDENGIANRYAGFFTTKKLGLDTLVLIGEEILRNPVQSEIDSALKTQKKSSIDSVAYVTMTADSAYSFPLTNYQTSIAETRSAGEQRILSEVTNQDKQKNLYKLKIDENALIRRNITASPTAYAKKRIIETKFDSLKSIEQKDAQDNTLARAKLYRYKPIKFSADGGALGLNSNILFNKYQLYANGSGPIKLNSNSSFNGLISLSTSDMLEDVHFSGAFKLGGDFKNNEWLISYQNIKHRLDFGSTVYRNATSTGVIIVDQFGGKLGQYPAKLITNLYQGNINYPFDKARSLRLTTGIRSDNLAVSTLDSLSSSFENQQTYYSLSHIEYVYDNTLARALNIFQGLRYKGYVDWNRQLDNKRKVGSNTFNFGFESRYYYPIYRNFIWAGRVAADFSWGDQKLIYYLGGVDGWLMFGNNVKPGTTRQRYFNAQNRPDNDQTYAFQTLAVNMRGFIQNAANGNNAVVLNSEFRLPVLSTFFDKTINNPFLRDFQLTQFIDLGTAWNGAYKGIKRPENTYTNVGGSPAGFVTVKQKLGGIGPFIGGYGFGARSTFFGYFVKYDVAWPMSTFFKGRAINYISLGLDF